MAADIIRRSDSPNLFELRITQQNSPVNLASFLSTTPFLLCLSITLPHFEDILKLSESHNGEATLVPFLRTCSFEARGSTSDEVIQAIQTLASTRFATSTSPTLPFNLTLNGKVATGYSFYPKRLNIRFDSNSNVLVNSTQFALQGWVRSVHYRRLYVDQTRLMEIFENFKDRYKPSSPSSASPSRRRVRPRLDFTEKEIEMILRRILDVETYAIGDIVVRYLSLFFLSRKIVYKKLIAIGYSIYSHYDLESLYS